MDITTQRKPTTPASVASDSFGSPPGNRNALHRGHPSSVSIASSIGAAGTAHPTTQTSYVHAGSASPPSGKAELHNVFAHGWQHQQHSQHPQQLQQPYHAGMPLSQNKQRLPSFSMHPFLSGASSAIPPASSHFNPAQMSSSPPGLGSSGFTSPVLSHNVSFTSPDQALPGVRVQGLGYFPGASGAVASAVFPPTQRSRSRRSSVGLAVSVSLASRSRSRTPMGSPPTSPSRRLSKEIGLGQQGQLDRILAGVASGNIGKDDPHTAQVNNATPGTGNNVFEFTDFGWDEAFEDDDEDGFLGVDGLGGNSKRHVDLVAEEDEEESSGSRGLGLASLEARARGISIGGGIRKDGLKSRTASRKSQLNQQRDDATLVGMDSGRPREHKNDMLPLGFKFGAGLPFQGEIIENVDPVGSLKARGKEVPGATCARFNSPRLGHARLAVGKAFEVIRKLGSGSYAMVYLVKEVGGIGQEYALKCLSKEHLEEEALDVQMFEATIHLSLPKHPNIVTLHQTLQTRKWLFLLLEMCPGEDLFYWLEHSRDSPPETIASSHEEHTNHNYRQPPLSSSNLPSSAIPYSTSAMIAGMGSSMSMSQSPAFAISKSHLSNDHHAGNIGHAGTPTTPSLLAAYSANALLSTRRLKLIASMFGQMCQAVALCHDVGVSHRDIKPENFICCDSEELAGTRDNEYGNEYDRKRVIVKLTDFGLATTNEISYDVECGSRPYMAYECRNELGPNYKPKPADVWSLGVVLLNMLFHRNPWTDPTPGNKNFEGFMEDPVEFLLTRFTGIGWEVATYLAERVFTMDIDARVSAAEFGRWSKNLPSMIGGRKAVHNLRLTHLNGHSSKGSLEFTKSPIEPRDVSSALSFKSPSTLSQTAPTAPKTSSSLRAPSIIHEWHETEHETENVTGKETVLTPPLTEEAEPTQDSVELSAAEQAKAKRKKRGTRSKNKAAQAAATAILNGLSTESPDPTVIEKEVILADLAEASQYLAREISSATKSTDKTRVIDLDEFPKLGETEAPANIKKSRWKALINSSNGNAELQALMKKVQERDMASAYQSAPAKLQHQSTKSVNENRSGASNASHTPSLSLASSSQLSSYNPTASLPGSSTGPGSDNWRRSPLSHDRGKQEELYRARDAAVSGHHPKNKNKTHSPHASLHESNRTARVNSPVADYVRSGGSTFGTTSSSDSLALHAGSADPQTPRPHHQPLLEERGFDSIHPYPNMAHVNPGPKSPSTERSSKLGASPTELAGNVPPTKLRMQISSLGKMLSGLKTSSKPKE